MKKVALLCALLHGPGLVFSMCPTTDGGMCIFPFKSGSTTYSECADYKGRKWCATSLKEDGMYKDYGYCDVSKCRATTGENMPAPSNCPTETGEKCIFPFKSGSTTHAECADYKGKKWCATSLQADGSYKGYGFCNAAKCGGGGAETTKGCVTDNGDTCVFPFKEGTTSHAKCANYRGTFWCATSLKANGAYDKWGKCKMDTCRPEASGNTCPTEDGAKCIFPFKDGSTTHNQCADYKGKKWCATSLKSDGSYAKYGYCDTAKCGTVTKPPASDCPTEKGKYCIFPFKSGSTAYDKCALYQGKHWCATSLNDDGTYKEYDYCDMAKCGGNEVTPKPPVVSTCPTVKGEYCVFPFKSGSTTHKKCAPYQGKHWCATSLKADGTYQEYDYCDMAKCGDIVTPTKPPVVSNCPTDAGKNCIFPFTDGSTTHSKCADYNGRKWCATSLKADGSYNGYGYCDMEKCGSEGSTNNPAKSCKCGLKGAKRIVGGEIAQPGEWPWIVIHSHRRTDGRNPGGCGGTLVADTWVVTAAHCFYTPATANQASKQAVFANSMSVVIGEHTISYKAQGFNILSDNDQFDTTLKRKNLAIEKIIIHENYKPGFVNHDIALLKLKEKLDLSVYMPACLPPKGQSWVDRTGWLYGWGTLYSGAKDISYILRETSQSIISNTVCEQGSGRINYTDPDTGVTSLVSVSMQGRLSDNMLCGVKAGTDSCQGDSGGPFTVEESGRHTLAGVVSWGLGCAAAGLAGVYSDVSNQRAWIDRQFAANGGTPQFCAP